MKNRVIQHGLSNPWVLRSVLHKVIEFLAFLVRDSFLRTLGRAAYRVLRRIWFANQTQDRGGVVFAGDSLIDQWATLAEDFPTIKVVNRGISGDVSRELLLRFHEDVLTCMPCVIVILVGTNDLADGVSPVIVAENIRNMVVLAAAFEEGIPTIVCQVLPRKMVKDLVPEAIYELNGLIDCLPNQNPNATVCGTFKHFATPGGMPQKDCFVDGLHLSGTGYRALTVALSTYLTKFCAHSGSDGDFA